MLNAFAQATTSSPVAFRTASCTVSCFALAIQGRSYFAVSRVRRGRPGPARRRRRAWRARNGRPGGAVHLLLVEAELSDHDEALRRERLVQLDEIDLSRTW